MSDGAFTALLTGVPALFNCRLNRSTVRPGGCICLVNWQHVSRHNHTAHTPRLACWSMSVFVCHLLIITWLTGQLNHSNFQFLTEAEPVHNTYIYVWWSRVWQSFLISKSAITQTPISLSCYSTSQNKGNSILYGGDICLMILSWGNFHGYIMQLLIPLPPSPLTIDSVNFNINYMSRRLLNSGPQKNMKCHN